MTYTMHIETRDGIKQHPFHLGTDLKIAETFVYERLGHADTLSIALRKDGKLVRIFDYRDLADQF